MGGFASVSGSANGTVMYADNASFDGTAFGGVLNSNGNFWIGASGSPYVRVGTITSPLGTLSIGYSAPNITMDIVGGAVAVEHLTGSTGGQLNPDVSNNFTLHGGTVAAGTTPVAVAGSGSTLTTNVQFSQAIAATNATNVGLSAFNSAQFTVDANGFVSTSGTGIANTLTGNSGGALSPTAGNFNIVTANSSLTFVGSGSTLTLNFLPSSNLYIGQDPPGTITSGLSNISITNNGTGLNAITSGNNNIAIGSQSGALTNSGFSNVFIGTGCGSGNTIGIQNTAVGTSCFAGGTSSNNTAMGVSAMSSTPFSGNSNCAYGYQSMAGILSGSQNCAMGYGSLVAITSGAQNVALGYFAGHAYTSSESNNICIGYNVTGTLGESNICRLGNSSITDTYLQGNIHLPQGQIVSVTRPGAYPYNILATDYVVSVDTSGAAPTVNLPASPVQGQTFIIKDRSANAAASNITISGNGYNIVGTTSAATQTISLNGASVTYVYDATGTIWLAI